MSGSHRRYEGREPVTRQVHQQQWVADLESSIHALDRELVTEEAVDAVNQTAPGTRVDIITHQKHGHPSTYLYSHLKSLCDGIRLADDGRCHCGGYVTRVVA